MNNNDKKYGVVFGLMIFLFIIIIAIIVTWRLGYIQFGKTENNGNNNNQYINQPKEKIEEQVKVDGSTLLYEYVNVDKNMGKCAQGDCNLYMKVKLPKIRLETNTVKNLNNSIEKIYKEAEDYYNQDFTKYENTQNDKYISYDIKYEAGYVKKLDYIWMDIIKGVIHTHASGSYDFYTIIYDVKNDKEVTIRELLNQINISEQKVTDLMKQTEDYKKIYSSNPNVIEKLEDSIKDFNDVHIENMTENSITLYVPLNLELCSVTINY
ncbi:MAG: hypothetical protein PHR25_01595 [Clostridia bacterium]|nr:hypothetical protein [Clostridia bacterium]MDD4375457.1 hypothetical protein [Clostridia bacterium]